VEGGRLTGKNAERKNGKRKTKKVGGKDSRKKKMEVTLLWDFAKVKSDTSRGGLRAGEKRAERGRASVVMEGRQKG